jgi:hypothetical protein
MPLLGLPAKPMNKNNGPLGMIGRDIDRRKPHQRVGRNAHLMTIQVKVDVHAGSLHEARRDVNFPPTRFVRSIYHSDSVIQSLSAAVR